MRFVIYYCLPKCNNNIIEDCLDLLFSYLFTLQPITSLKSNPNNQINKRIHPPSHKSLICDNNHCKEESFN